MSNAALNNAQFTKHIKYDENGTITAQSLYDLMKNLRIVKDLQIDFISLETFEKVYEHILHDKRIVDIFGLGKFLGKGMYKVAMENKKDSKQIVKVTVTYQNKNAVTDEEEKKSNIPQSQMKVANNNNFGDIMAKMFAENKNESSFKKKQQKSYPFESIINDLLLAYNNTDVINPPINIHIYTTKDTISKISDYIKSQQQENAYKKNLLSIITFVEHDVGILQSIFVWTELKYTMNLGDYLKSKQKRKNTHNHDHKSPKRSALGHLQTFRSSHTTKRNRVNNTQNNISHKKISSDDKKEFVTNFFNLLKAKKLKITDLHSGNIGLFGDKLLISNSQASNGELTASHIKYKLINMFKNKV